MDGLCPPFCPQISSCAPTKHLSAAPGHVARHLGEEPGLCSDQPLGGSSGALSEPPGERDPRGRGLLRGPPWAGLRALYWGHQGARSSGDLSLAPLLSPPSYASALRSRRHKVPWPWLDLAWLEHNARPVLPPPWQRGRVLPPAPPPPSGLWSFRPEPLFRAICGTALPAPPASLLSGFLHPGESQAGQGDARSPEPRCCSPALPSCCFT